jgi:hypothetical protein
MGDQAYIHGNKKIKVKRTTVRRKRKLRKPKPKS